MIAMADLSNFDKNRFISPRWNSLSEGMLSDMNGPLYTQYARFNRRKLPLACIHYTNRSQ
ncbi:hypothetical protein PRIPAC_74141 [Pristionchus pacificus]|uniref:Uncharacterized protein n=1 Tax=Pristionchus pacificus TaxID=54126 RepID=A0A2A6C8L5_PRIPA|nr:hypothetical protein PRIPAC_74141 [Pristionchus pacificus]|eukprot:PDM74524.1 hypothetical protein PRIPAC_41880 [Pristionchus pacificus]